MLDHATPLDDPHDLPDPGSLSVCVYCATLLRFTENLSVERAPDELVQNLSPSDRREVLLLQQAVWLAVMRRKG